MRSEVNDTPVAVGEDDVDREAHAEGVNRLTGRDDQRGILRQAVTAEQPAAAGYRIERPFELSGDNEAVSLVPEQKIGGILCQQRLEKVRLRHARARLASHCDSL